MKRRLSVLVIAVALCPVASCGGATATHTASTGTPSASGQDRAWLVTIHQANLAEVQAGELAEKKGGTAAVRAAGAMLVTDHTASDAQVTRVAKSLAVALPGSAAPQDAAAAGRLANEAGAQFDHDFVATMMTGHQNVIAETQKQIAQGTAPQVKGLAQTTLPILRKHLATLRKASAS